jgi:hypothetical protein
MNTKMNNEIAKPAGVPDLRKLPHGQRSKYLPHTGAKQLAKAAKNTRNVK